MSTRNIYVAGPRSSHLTLYHPRLTSPSLRSVKDLALSFWEWQDPSFILERPGMSRVDYRLCESEQWTSDEIRFAMFFSSVFSEVFSIGDSSHLYHSFCPFQSHRPTLIIPPFHQRCSKSGEHIQFEYKHWSEDATQGFLLPKLGSVRERRTLANFPRIVAFERADSHLSNGRFASSVGPKVHEIKPFELV